MRAAAIATAICFFILGIATAAEGEAAIRKHTDIPAQRLETALQALAQDRNLQVICRTEVVGDLRTPGASGELTRDEALKQLLTGTALTYKYLDDKTITILPTRPAASSTQSGLGMSPSSGSASENPSPGTGEGKGEGTEGRDPRSGKGEGKGEGKKGFWARLARATPSPGTGEGGTLREGEGDKQPSSESTDSEDKLTEVVVTATKTGETGVQSTPISISAFTEADIQNRGIDRLEDLAMQTPGFTFSQNEQFIRLFIRGVGSTNDFLGSDPSSTIHIDGVYMARPVSLFTELADVERIEVLRGPQGTLYGRNSVGGTINVITKTPTNDFESEIKAEYGAAERVRVEAAVRGPIIEDRLRASLSLLRSQSEGYVKNRRSALLFEETGPEAVLNDDITIIRGALQWLPAETVEIMLRADRTDQGGQPSVYSATNDQAFPFRADGGGFPFLGGFDEIDLDFTPIHKLENWGVSADLSWEVTEGVEFSALTSYRQQEFYAQNDIDGSPGAFLSCCGGETAEHFSQELQLNSSSGDRLTWVVGLFYFSEDGYFNLEYFDDALNPSFSADEDVNIDTKAYAAFGQASLAITEALTATAGVRYSYEKKSIDALRFGELQVEEVDWDAVTPKFGLDYAINEDVMAYASVTRGFKSGGFNAFETQPAFDPEFLWSYEAGLKADMMDNRLRVNLAGFYYDYTDLQVQRFTDISVEVSNAASSTIKGIEAEIFARPSPGLHLNLGLMWLDAKYDDYLAGGPFETPGSVLSPNGNFVRNVRGNRLTSTPEWSVNAGMQYQRGLSGGGTILGRIDGQWQSEVFYDALNEPRLSQDGYGLLNARIAYATANGNLEFAVYGKNLTNKEYYSALFEFGSIFGAPEDVWGQVQPPRIWGVQASYRM